MLTIGCVVAAVAWRIATSIAGLGEKIDAATQSLDRVVESIDTIDDRVHDHESRITRPEDRCPPHAPRPGQSRTRRGFEFENIRRRGDRRGWVRNLADMVILAE